MHHQAAAMPHSLHSFHKNVKERKNKKTNGRKWYKRGNKEK